VREATTRLCRLADGDYDRAKGCPVNIDIDQKLTFNGIDARSGGYMFEPLSTAELAGLITGNTPAELDPDSAKQHLAELGFRRAQTSEAHFGVKAGVDPTRLDEAGWAVIFPAVDAGSQAAREQAAIREALAPLLALREAQASKRHGHYYKEYRGSLGYRPGETKQQFLARLGAGPGPADPDRVPYYLLIVGSPELIPYHVQYQLDVQYAVGRIDFDTIQEYGNYARSVVAAETGGGERARELALIGVANPDDAATTLSRKHLVGPLAERIAGRELAGDWTITRYFDERADKASVARLYGGPQTPALIVSASHGMAFARSDPLQQRHQGALLLQDWPGPKQWRGPIDEALYFSGDDLRSDEGLLGMISFNFACYGGGTPRHDELARQAGKRTPIADKPFVAELHRKLLSHPRGGALASIGHVERAWGYSFMWGTGEGGAAEPQLAVFESAIEALMSGMPVGVAIEYFNQRYAELASDLSVHLEELEFDPRAIDAATLAMMWTASNDARGFAILGDPAVRLRFAGAQGDQPERARVELSSFAAEPEVVEPSMSSEESAEPPEDLIARLRARLAEAVESLATLEVRSYRSNDVAAASQGSDPDAELFAHTRIELDGRAELIVARREGAVDSELLAQHLALVEQTRKARTATIETLLAAIVELQKSR